MLVIKCLGKQFKIYIIIKFLIILNNFISAELEVIISWSFLLGTILFYINRRFQKSETQERKEFGCMEINLIQFYRIIN